MIAIYSEPRSSEDIMESYLKAEVDAEKDVELYKLSLVKVEKEQPPVSIAHASST